MEARTLVDSGKFGRLMRQFRREAHLTQEELASRAGYSISHIRKLENGMRRPTSALLDMLCDALDLTDEERSSLRAAAASETRTRAVSVPANNLQYPVNSFIGRTKELDRIRANLLRQDARWLTITGPGGIGKSRLALEAAKHVLPVFEDGVFIISLDSVDDSQLVMYLIAHAIDLPATSEHPITDQLRDYLQNRHVLLVLDSCERVSEAMRSVMNLVQTCHRLNILATSRTLLPVYGQREFPLEPLEIRDAVELFTERAQRIHPNEIEEDSALVTVAKICERLDQLPLAIELAAAHIRFFPLETLLDRVSDRLDMLSRGPDYFPARQKTLRATIDWSYSLLGDPERRIFERLAVFVGGVSLDAAESVCGIDGDLRSHVLHGIETLVEHSLLHRVGSDGPRFDMLETVRDYAAECLQASGQEERVRHQHMSWCLDFVEISEHEIARLDHVRSLERLDVEYANIRAAFRYALDVEEGETALRFVAGLRRFWLIRGYYREGRRWVAGALALQDGTANGRSKALTAGGMLAFVQGDYEEASELWTNALRIRREIRDTQGIANLLNNLGLVAQEKGDYSQAEALHLESLELQRELDNASAIAHSLDNLGIVSQELGQYHRAGRLYEESLALRRQVGDVLAIAASLHNLGVLSGVQEDYETAGQYLKEGLELRQLIGDRAGIAASLTGLGSLAREQGDYDRASKLQRESLAMFSELGAKRGIAHCVEELALVAIAAGSRQRGARLAGAAQALRAQIGAPLPPSERARYEESLGLAFSQPERDAWFASYEEGQAMSLEQMLGLALESDLAA